MKTTFFTLTKRSQLSILSFRIVSVSLCSISCARNRELQVLLKSLLNWGWPTSDLGYLYGEVTSFGAVYKPITFFWDFLGQIRHNSSLPLLFEPLAYSLLYQVKSYCSPLRKGQSLNLFRYLSSSNAIYSA